MVLKCPFVLLFLLEHPNISTYILGCLMKYRRMNENNCPQNFWLIFTPCKVLCYRTPTIYTFFVSHYNFGQVYKLLFDKKQRWKLAVCTLNCQLLWEKWISKGKSLSEAFIFASTNPQYDDRLFFELQVQYMKNPSSEHVVYRNCFRHSEQFFYTTCSPHILQK